MSNAGRKFRIAAILGMQKEADRLDQRVRHNKHCAGSDWDEEMYDDRARIRRSTNLRVRADELLNKLLDSDEEIKHRY